MWIFTFIYIVYEFTKWNHQRKEYFKKLENILNIATLISFPLISFHTDPIRKWDSVALQKWQYHINGCAIFFTWVVQMLLIGRIPRYGIYVEVFRKVSKTFMNFILAFFFLFLAFTLSFVAFFDTGAFNHPSVVFKVSFFLK